MKRSGRKVYFLGICLVVLFTLRGGSFASDIVSTGSVFIGDGETGEKPQSKLWYNDGKWWAVLLDGADNYIFKLSNGALIKQSGGYINDVDGVRADVLWDGEFLFVLMANSSGSKLYKFVYLPGTESYDSLSGFPVSLPLGTKWGVICEDTTGKLWITDCFNGEARVIWSTSADHRSWNLTGMTLGAATMTSVVSRSPATEEAFCNA